MWPLRRQWFYRVTKVKEEKNKKQKTKEEETKYIMKIALTISNHNIGITILENFSTCAILLTSLIAIFI